MSLSLIYLIFFWQQKHTFVWCRTINLSNCYLPNSNHWYISYHLWANLSFNLIIGYFSYLPPRPCERKDGRISIFKTIICHAILNHFKGHPHSTFSKRGEGAAKNAFDIWNRTKSYKEMSRNPIFPVSYRRLLSICDKWS